MCDCFMVLDEQLNWMLPIAFFYADGVVLMILKIFSNKIKQIPASLTGSMYLYENLGSFTN